jgi:isoleucyl-tRNA synthetase
MTLSCMFDVITKGIAVHPGLTYVALRPCDENQQARHVVIVAKDRMEVLKDIVGPADIIAEFQGDVRCQLFVPHLFTIRSGSELVDTPYAPLFSNSSRRKIIPAVYVASESGTGLVHCAPAHGGEDYQAFLALNLLSGPNPMICHVNGEGKFTAEVANVVGDSSAGGLVGLEVLTDGSKAVVELLKRTGSLVKVQRIKHRYPYDWKTNEPIIMTSVLIYFSPLHPDPFSVRRRNGLQTYPILRMTHWMHSTGSRSILLPVSYLVLVPHISAQCH